MKLSSLWRIYKFGWRRTFDVKFKLNETARNNVKYQTASLLLSSFNLNFIFLLYLDFTYLFEYMAIDKVNILLRKKFLHSKTISPPLRPLINISNYFDILTGRWIYRERIEQKVKSFDVTIREITREKTFMVATKAAIVDDWDRLRRSFQERQKTQTGLL